MALDKTSSQPNKTFIPFSTQCLNISKVESHNIYNFTISEHNIDPVTVEAFGDEWSKFNYFSDDEISSIAQNHYFDIVPTEYYKNKQVLDVGCGTGRWTKFVAKDAKTVDAVDPSKAIEAAAKLLSRLENVRLSRTAVDNLPFEDNSFDFVFSLGVLHHIPDTQLAMQKCVDKLKPEGHFLTYLYYRFDNRGFLFKTIFKISDMIRKFISGQPASIKNTLCDIVAIVIYMPLILLGSFFKKIGLQKIAHAIPLHFYIGKTFNVIKNDARDRFGTPLEQRFTKAEIEAMMKNCGLSEIIFSNKETYWHAVGKKN
jgi:ubiquinone/menaquinone biosynthesis C-methylase UbiE